MVQVHEVIPAGAPAVAAVAGTVTLTFDQRRHSRLLAHLDDGRELALMLPRGTVLRDGDRLRARDGATVIVVRAAPESLSVAHTSDALLLTRAAYHLGNRHVPLQVGADFLAYAHDHVLDDMVRGLGLHVQARTAPFQPEAGAFHGEGGHPHGPAHDHAHDHSHKHDDEGHHHH